MPDLMAVFQKAAQETRGQGFFCLTFFHWLVPGLNDIVIVHDLKLVKKLLSKENWAVYQKGSAYRIAADLIGYRGLLASPDNDLWHAQRRVSSAAFKRSTLESALIPNVHELIDTMCLRWEAAASSNGGERPVVQFEKEAVRLTIGILGRLAFGFDFERGDGGDSELGPGGLGAAFECVLQRMADFGNNPLLYVTRKVPTSSNRAYWRALHTIDASVKATLDSRLAESDLGDDLLGQLLRASQAEGSALDTDLIVENLKTFLFAGHDTTASTLSWALHLVSTHPEVEAALVKELAPLGTSPPSCQALEALPYLDAVVKETLRLYPPAGFTREPYADVEIGGYLVPKGTQVYIIPYLVHRNESLTKNAERFEPSRWLGAEAQAQAPESAGWLPFSLGARNCVGMHVAKLELKATLHALLMRYHFEAVLTEGPPEVVLYMTLVPNSVPLIPRHRAEQR